MLGLRKKLSLGFIGLLLITIVLGLESVKQIDDLGRAISVILIENYRSVVACQQMKKALERVDSGILLTLLGYEQKGDVEIDESMALFRKELATEKNNITVAGESEEVDKIEEYFERYTSTLERVKDVRISADRRRDIYFTELYPLFKSIIASADNIINMNQENMIYEKTLAQNRAREAREQMYIYLLVGAALASLWMFFTRRWILNPINRLIAATDDIRRGNLDLVLKSDSNDEIGRLSEAINTMAAGLREFRRTNRSKMLRIQRSSQEAFRNLPGAVAVVSLDGVVELSSVIAQEVFGLKPDTRVQELPFPWLTELLEEAVKTSRPVEPTADHAVIQHFVRNDERYYRPRAVPFTTLDNETIGVIFIIEDITQVMFNDEMRRGMISTVSHQLKTPLTSIRMALHLLLDEKTGTLSPKQEELLIAARDDGERLYTIIEGLLDIGRIESGKLTMEFRPVSVSDMITQSVDEFRSAALDAGLSLQAEGTENLPEAYADPSQIRHVLDNLLSNAVKFTPSGGSITTSARFDRGFVYITVSDTGMGIPPENQARIFDQFFTSEDKEGNSGVGLGLYIANEIVQAHGGAIEVKSRPGRGSAFTFTLRRADAVKQEEKRV